MKKEEINKCINMLISEDLEIRKLGLSIIEENLNLDYYFCTDGDGYKLTEKNTLSPFKGFLKFLVDTEMTITRDSKNCLSALNLLHQCPQKTKE